MYCGTLTAAYNLLYEKFTCIGEILFARAKDNTEGSNFAPVETKCEIFQIYLGESYSPIPSVMKVLSLLTNAMMMEVKHRCVRQVGLLSTAGVDS